MKANNEPQNEYLNNSHEATFLFIKFKTDERNVKKRLLVIEVDFVTSSQWKITQISIHIHEIKNSSRQKH